MKKTPQELLVEWDYNPGLLTSTPGLFFLYPLLQDHQTLLNKIAMASRGAVLNELRGTTQLHSWFVVI